MQDYLKLKMIVVLFSDLHIIVKLAKNIFIAIDLSVKSVLDYFDQFNALFFFIN